MVVFGIVLVILIILLFLFYASAFIGSGIYLNAFCRKQTAEKIVALTFDDGLHAVQTPKVLDVLKSYHVVGTFFCIGSNINGNEVLLQRMVAEGHTVGNHSYTHTWAFPFYTARQMTDDLARTQDLLEHITGKPVCWFRPPFGVTNPTIDRVVRRLGLTVIGWNIRTFDTGTRSNDKILKRISKRLIPGSVILLHDRMPGSDRLLADILDLLIEKGYRVVSLETMI